MKTAGLPAAKTIEEYDLRFHPQLDKQEVMYLFDMDSVPKRGNAARKHRRHRDLRRKKIYGCLFISVSCSGYAGNKK
jgi:hypothetical protein